MKQISQTVKQIDSYKTFGGTLARFAHQSKACNCEMQFSIFLPPQASASDTATLYYLSGLTCTDENVRSKAGAQQHAARLGLALVMPDTSPRGRQVIDYPERYDIGKGAGFYLDATEPNWRNHYRMYSYVTDELPQLIEQNFAVAKGIKSICGHSMGGHGALLCALKKPNEYKSVSAFAPIANPTQSPWGKDCFTTYLGEDQRAWQGWDATCLINNGAKLKAILIDQGDADEFYTSGQLLPQNLVLACTHAGIEVNYRLQLGYDHSYYFVASFIAEHIAYHHGFLQQALSK